MFLKKLELHGFKSFAKRTVLDFPQGITVVAGPNGAGKSNIVDALRWVLAEQSLKNLRSKKGEELIFHGSQGRSALSHAAVQLAFEETQFPLGNRVSNSNKSDPLVHFKDLTEVVISRAVSRDGSNSYWLNNRRVRLLDLEEFLAQSAIGSSDSFRILSQGMSDKLLTLSPQEFRSFIEEAAGVKEFQDKKYQAVLKLKNTQENLDRVALILAELKPKLKILKREQDRLAKKEADQAQLKELAAQVLGVKYQAFLASEIKIAQKKHESKQILKPLRQAVALLKEELFSFDKKTVLSQELTSLTQEFNQLQFQENQLAREIIAQEGKINLGQEREKQRLPVSLDYLKEKISQLVGQLNIDFKGLDINQLRHVLEQTQSALGQLLAAISQGVNPMDQAQNFALLKNGLEKLLTRQSEIKKMLENTSWAKMEKEKQFLDLRQASLEQEKTYRRQEAELRLAEDSLRQLELEEEKLKLHQEKLHQDIGALGVVTLAEILDSRKTVPAEHILLASFSDTTGDGAPFTVLAQEEDKLWKLKRKIDEIGLIDPGVIKEFESVKERYDFLEKESVDLKVTLVSLEGLIKDLENAMTKQYGLTLTQMNQEFGNYFRLIFGGGRAALAESRIKNKESRIINHASESNKSEDQNGESEADSGVEIKLELPNKKVKSLNTLSGGEKTLVSIALLFALTSIRQPPLMVLDEIDAALDEVNTQKFIRLLKELSHKTQFIVVSHNRETMRHADALYGVSMKDGISRLLSLKLQSA